MGAKKRRETAQLKDAELHIKKCFEYAERGIEEIKMSEFSDLLNRILITRDILVLKFRELYPDKNASKPFTDDMSVLIKEIFDEYFPRYKLRTRETPCVWYRQCYFYLMRKHTAESFKNIGSFWKMNHTTVVHADNAVKMQLECKDNVYVEIVNFVEDKIKEKLHQITIQTENHE